MLECHISTAIITVCEFDGTYNVNPASSTVVPLPSSTVKPDGTTVTFAGKLVTVGVAVTVPEGQK